MDIMEAIFTRRSIRKYTDKEISGELVKKLLQAAMAAPSAGNKQPFQFIVIRERSTLEQIPTFHRHGKPITGANLGILICGDQEIEFDRERIILDCAAATENMLLAAHALGLGAVWLGIYPVEERIAGIRKLLDIPAHIDPVSLVSLGYPGEQFPVVDRYKAERIHYERWTGAKEKK
jgi:nitroreductase